MNILIEPCQHTLLQCFTPSNLKYNTNYKTSLEGKDASDGNDGDSSRESKSRGTAGDIGRVGLLRGGEGVLKRLGLRSVELDGVTGRSRRS